MFLGEGEEILYNGIRLPEEWPPRGLAPYSQENPPVPYLDSPPPPVPIDVGGQLSVDDSLVEETTLPQRVLLAKGPTAQCDEASRRQSALGWALWLGLLSLYHAHHHHAIGSSRFTPRSADRIAAGSPGDSPYQRAALQPAARPHRPTHSPVLSSSGGKSPPPIDAFATPPYTPPYETQRPLELKETSK